MMYCLPVMPIVTTKMSEAVPMTMPRAVNMNRTFAARNESIARLAISANGIVLMEASLGSIWWRTAVDTEFIVNWNRNRCGGLRQSRIQIAAFVLALGIGCGKAPIRRDTQCSRMLTHL